MEKLSLGNELNTNIDSIIGKSYASLGEDVK